MKRKIETAVIYCRQRRDYSTAYQIGSSMALIHDRGLKFCGVYVDAEDIDNLWQLVQDWKRIKFDAVIISSEEIISDDEKLPILEDLPILFVASQEAFASKRNFNIFTFEYEEDAFTDEHRKKLSDSNKRVSDELLKSGYFVGRTPYGYISSNNELVSDRENTARVVKEIFAQAKNKHSPSEICNFLNNLSIPTPSGGKCWRIDGVQKILSNDVYCGSEHVETIIGRELFEQVQSELKPKKKLGFRNSGPFPMCVCDVCNRHLSYSDPERQPRLKTASYHCDNHNKPGEIRLDKTPRITVDAMRQAVLDRCKDFFTVNERELLDGVDRELAVFNEQEKLRPLKMEELGQKVLALKQRLDDRELSETEYYELVGKTCEDYSGLWLNWFNGLMNKFVMTLGKYVIRRYAPILYKMNYKMKEYDPAIGKQIINSIRLKPDGTVSVIFFGDELLKREDS